MPYTIHINQWSSKSQPLCTAKPVPVISGANRSTFTPRDCRVDMGTGSLRIHICCKSCATRCLSRCYCPEHLCVQNYMEVMQCYFHYLQATVNPASSSSLPRPQTFAASVLGLKINSLPTQAYDPGDHVCSFPPSP